MALIIYTTPAHENIVCDYATSTASGYDKQNVIDQNLNTVWKPTSTSNQGLEFDCGSQQSVDAFAIWISNYSTNFSTMQVYLYGRNTTGGSWQYQSSSAISPSNGVPLALDELSSAINYRYYRITFEVVPAVPEISHIFLLRKREIGTAEKYPFGLGYRFENLRSGKFISPRYTNYTREFKREYEFALSANQTAMNNAFIDSGGSARPIILKEGSDDPILCRFASDSYDVQEVDYDYYRASLSYETLPYIADGDTY